jgi:hypothetical protein
MYGFLPSDELIDIMEERFGIYPNCNEEFGIKSKNKHAYRADPRLIGVAEELGMKRAGDEMATIGIVEIPDGVEWYLEVYKGIDIIHANHQWWMLGKTGMVIEEKMGAEIDYIEACNDCRGDDAERLREALERAREEENGG